MNSFWFGMSLTARRGASTRFSTIVTAVAIGIGVVLLLTVASVPTALDRRAARADDRVPLLAATAPRIVVADRPDLWDGRKITRVLVGSLEPGAPPPPGVDRLPLPGEVVLSPALTAASDGPDGAELRGRYAGQRLTTIGDTGLLEPNEMIAYIGVDPAVLVQQVQKGELDLASGFGTKRGQAIDDDDPRGVAAAASGAVALLLGALLVMLVGVATRLAANARSARLAALRLVGASIHQCRRVVAGEIAVASIAGTALGAALFALVRLGPLRWWWPAPWFPSDLYFGPLSVMVLVGAPILSQVVARVGSRSAVNDAFAVRRRAPRRLAVAPRLAASAASVLLLAFVAVEPGWISRSLRGQLLILGVCVFLVSLPLALPVVIRLAATGWSRRARGLVSRLSSSRIAFEPSAATRPVVATAAALIIASVIAGVFTESPVLTNNQVGAARGDGRYLAVEEGELGGLATELRAVDGVSHVLEVPLAMLVPTATTGSTGASTTVAPSGAPSLPGDGPVVAQALTDGPRSALAVSCPDAMLFFGGDPDQCGGATSAVVAATDPFGHEMTSCEGSGCPAVGSSFTVIDFAGNPLGEATWPSATVDAPLSVSAAALGLTPTSPWIDPSELAASSLPNQLRVFVRTDGSDAVEQRVRSVAQASSPLAAVRSLPAKTVDDEVEIAVGRDVARAGVVLALVLALSAVVVAGVDSLLDRRQLNGTLLSLGMRVQTLRSTQSLFLLAPLAVAGAVGVVVGSLFGGVLDRYNNRPFGWRSGSILVAIAALVLAGLCVQILTRFTVRRAVAADAIRRE